MKQLVTLKIDKQLLRSFDASANHHHLNRTAWLVQAGIAMVRADVEAGARFKVPPAQTDGRRRAK